jgi:hypothetical protein
MRAVPVNTGKEGKRLAVIPAFRALRATLFNYNGMIFSFKE